MYYFLGINDIIFTPLYLVITIFFLILLSKKVQPPLLRKYFLWGAVTKIMFAILFGVVYEFYYSGGDTSAYYYYGKLIGETLWKSPIVWLKLILAYPPEIDTYEVTSKIHWYHDSAAYFPSRLVGIISPFCFGTYSIISIFFSLTVFSGQWAMFMVFYRQFPKLHKQLAIAVFFGPSVIFWGAGIMKDGIALGALGWLLYGSYFLIIERQKVIISVFVILFSSWVLIIVKIYILISFVPVLFVWFFLVNINKIKNVATRTFLTPIMISIAIFTGLYAVSVITEQNERYSIDKLVGTAQMTSSYLLTSSKDQGGAYYDIGKIEISIGGLMKIIPQGINVTLFRPYLWETKNAFMLISALESFATLIFTLYILFRIGLTDVLGKMKKHPFVIFSLIFSMVFAFAVGISTSNFGTLVRYKLPMLPFYWSVLFIIYSEKDEKKL